MVPPELRQSQASLHEHGQQSQDLYIDRYTNQDKRDEGHEHHKGQQEQAVVLELRPLPKVLQLKVCNSHKVSVAILAS